MPATSVMACERHIPNRNGSLRCALFAASNIPSTGSRTGLLVTLEAAKMPTLSHFYAHKTPQKSAKS
jgi:hypothetical protein